MEYHLSFRPYQRPFVKPLRTAHGEWSVREGFIVRFRHDSKVGYGEVAPIPIFGTETLEAAGAYLQSLTDKCELPTSAAVPDILPCCTFGISAACSGRSPKPKRNYSIAALLPAGRAALDSVTIKIRQGYTTFKWKIGVEPIAVEQAILTELLKRLSFDARIRLDANGGLPVEALERWLSLLRNYRQQIDYLEQPLPVGQEASMARYAKSFQVPIALDESLHGAGGIRWLEAGAWLGPLVIKPALMGDRDKLVERLRPIARQVVLSSVFETAIGLENALSIADQLPELNRAVGFDTLEAFSDALMPLSAFPVITEADRNSLSFADIWERL
jgi:o-succinylbenzoate synthase